MKLFNESWILRASALLFAVLTYFYIHNELNTLEKQKKSSDPSYKLIKLTAKVLPLKVRLATAPPDGYRVLADKVSSKPSQVMVIGPEALLESASSAETAIVDISESTKTAVKQIPLESVAGIHLAGDPYAIEVTVPIEEIKKPESK